MKRNFSSTLFCLALGILVSACIREADFEPPQISPLSKASYTSGEAMLIRGNYFDPLSTQVLVDNKEVLIAGTPSLTEVTVIVPETTEAKAVPLFVKTKYGSSSTVTFTILPPLPVINKVIPDKAGIGRTIRIQGSHLAGVTEALFKSPSSETLTSSTVKRIAEDTLEVTVPAGLAFDAAELRLGTPNGRSELASFTVLHPPLIASFNPVSGGAGTTVKLLGQYLSSIRTVKAGGETLEVLSSTETAVDVRISERVKTDTIFIDTWGGAGKSGTVFTIIPGPAITTLSPASGAPGTEITIAGEAFSNAFDVRFGSISTEILSNSGTLIKVKVPVGSGNGKVSVATPGGIAVSTVVFTVPNAPVIVNFTPVSGIPGTMVTLSGLNFGSATSTPHSMAIGLQPLTNVVWTDSKIEGTIPAGAVTGKMVITTPDGTFETSGLFTISGSVQVLNFTPSSGLAGTPVTITGINMGTSPDVRFNNIRATVITKATPTEIQCQVPTGATTGKINVNGALSPGDFTVSTAPVITAVSPSRGGVDTEVTIIGSALLGSTVKFSNNVTAAKTGTDTDSQIKVKVPAGAISGKITVTTPGGSASSLGNFEIVPGATVTSFLPLAGGVGSVITISGTNLHYNPVVKFGGNTTALVKSSSATQLIVEVPAGAIDGRISVMTEASPTPVVSAATFDVLTAPAIVVLSPNFGTIGQKVIITGTDFTNLVSVNFGGAIISSYVSIATATQIEVLVPNTVAPGSVNVSVKTSIGVSSNATFVVSSPPIIDYISPDNNPVNWPVSINGRNLSGVKKVLVNGVVTPIDYLSQYIITLRIPPGSLAGPGTVKLYYSDENFVSAEYRVLSAPPLGVFPPPFIVFPSPPGNFVPVNVDADWPNPYESEHYFRIDARSGSFDLVNGNKVYHSTGQFDIVEHYNGNDPEKKIAFDLQQGSGNWNGNRVSFNIRGVRYVGNYNAGFQMIFQDEEGRQLLLGNSCPNFPDCK